MMKKEKVPNTGEFGEETEVRARTPDKSEGEMFAEVIEMLGAYHLKARCEDGKIRVCRIPGKHIKRMWIKIGDILIVRPWPVSGDKKADVVYRYTSTEVEWLKRKNLLTL